MEQKMRIQAVSPLLGTTVPLPSYQSEGAAAMDICACMTEDIVILPMARAMVPTGFAIETPPGMVTLLFGRSGLGVKQGVTLSNCVGVIDSDYRGEVKVGLTNYGETPFTIHTGDRIAQMAVVPVVRAQLELSESLSETGRGSGGFGSTGR